MKHKAINGWGLLLLVSIPMSILNVFEMLETDMSTGEGISHMIGYSVRFAIPFIFMVVAASSLQILFPGPIPAWCLRNRKYIGLCFAVAMAWQGAFIFIVSTFHRIYYFEEIYLFRDELEGTIGYLFLAAMVVTSFHFGRKYVDKMQWKLIHKSGVYFLWAYPFSVYWWNLFYYPTVEPFSDPRLLDYAFYLCGFLAFSARIAAWGKRRRQAAIRVGPDGSAPLAYRVFGGAIITFGVIAAATGRAWLGPFTALVESSPQATEMVLWLPFWPLEPFLPVLIIGLGTMQATKAASPAAARATELAD